MHVPVEIVTRPNCEWLIKTVTIYLVVTHQSDICGNSRVNTCARARLPGSVAFVSYETSPLGGFWTTRDKSAERMTRVGAAPFRFLTYQLWAVGYWPTAAMTGGGELGFDSGEGA